MAIVQSYGAIKPQPSATMRRNRLAFMGISALALAAVIAVVVISAPVQPQAEMLEDFPQTDLDLLNVMV